MTPCGKSEFHFVEDERTSFDGIDFLPQSFGIHRTLLCRCNMTLFIDQYRGRDGQNAVGVRGFLLGVEVYGERKAPLREIYCIPVSFVS